MALRHWLRFSDPEAPSIIFLQSMPSMPRTQVSLGLSCLFCVNCAGEMTRAAALSVWSLVCGVVRIFIITFISFHPDFKRNVQAAPIRSVDIYNLMCWTLGVKPLPNNGSWSRVEYLLNSSDDPSLPTTLCCMSAIGVLLALWH